MKHSVSDMLATNSSQSESFNTQTRPASSQSKIQTKFSHQLLAQGKERGKNNHLYEKLLEIGESEVTVVKREGNLAPFRHERIQKALEAAFRDTKKIAPSESIPEEYREIVEENTRTVIVEAISLAQRGTTLTVEGIQDLVEVILMRNGHHDVARDYIIYRDHHKELRKNPTENVKIVRSDGAVVSFQPLKITTTIKEAMQRESREEEILSVEDLETINRISQAVIAQLCVQKEEEGYVIPTRRIEDEIGRQMMQENLYEVAKKYILSCAERVKEKPFSAISEKKKSHQTKQQFTVIREDGSQFFITREEVKKKMEFVCRDLEGEISSEEMAETSFLNFYEGMKESEVAISHIMAARTKIEREPMYARAAARLLFDIILQESLGAGIEDASLEQKQRRYFPQYIHYGVQIGRLDPRLLEFDLERLSRALRFDRDEQWGYLGLQNLYDRYFIHKEQNRLETPQIFWMRVAMGIALNEGEHKTRYAMQFYDALSSFSFISSTPTLFNSGTIHPQLSSCYLLTIKDDLSHIFKTVSDDAQLSKWAGGIGNDWSNVRATGASIQGTNGKSQGIIPFLKVANDTAVAVNQGGKRKGAMCAYLESWHLDIEDFLELRKNTGDERRRTHDMNTANWIPDLFMKRVHSNRKWTLFSPHDVPDLHSLYGKDFEKRYEEYEKMAREGEIRLYKEVEAKDLWRKMLGMLFETGHPWITFKDPSNIRSAQSHVGVVNSSNLCTEILLNTSEKETAVCNLGSINLVAHVTEEGLHEKKIAQTVSTAIRMLDNVIDINFYPTQEAHNANMKHRPVGLGMMGFQDALYMQGISYASHEAVDFSDKSMEMISYYAILSSSLLAKERGTYSSYQGSKWDQGMLPIDTLDLLEKERGEFLQMDRSMHMDWEKVRCSVKEHGMRNSQTMAIAPTATISNIIAVSQSIEPMYKHLFVKSNLSGEFTISNVYLVEALREQGLWDEEMLDDLKYFDGNIAEIARIPEKIKKVFLTAFEIDPEWIIACASRRQKWIDMGQSLNLYLNEPSGKKLEKIYMDAWLKGLKTCYYLRSQGATQIEKSTTDINKRGLQPRWMKNSSASSRVQLDRERGGNSASNTPSTPLSCSMEEGCESCQ